MKFFFDTFPTPCGAFSAAIDESGAVVATAFGGREALGRRTNVGHVIRDKSRLAPVRAQVTAYFAGRRSVFTLPLAPRGTPFQQRVWTVLQKIPFGHTRSYRDVAAELGNSAAARAVGRANATNPICLVVPCHRVIGADGALTGFAFGEAVKRRLLEHEHVPAFCR